MWKHDGFFFKKSNLISICFFKEIISCRLLKTTKEEKANYQSFRQTKFPVISFALFCKAKQLLTQDPETEPPVSKSMKETVLNLTRPICYGIQISNLSPLLLFWGDFFDFYSLCFKQHQTFKWSVGKIYIILSFNPQNREILTLLVIFYSDFLEAFKWSILECAQNKETN